MKDEQYYKPCCNWEIRREMPKRGVLLNQFLYENKDCPWLYHCTVSISEKAGKSFIITAVDVSLKYNVLDQSLSIKFAPAKRKISAHFWNIDIFNKVKALIDGWVAEQEKTPLPKYLPKSRNGEVTRGKARLKQKRMETITRKE